jgi:chemotaxis protein methyltransferase CheR
VSRDAISGCRVEILGTDIDRRMIERARAGWFADDEVREADEGALRRWFDRESNGWRARPELASMTRFEVADLLRTTVRPGTYDLVLCRNVVIYFTEAVRNDLHARLAESLRPDGYLLIGSTERIAEPAAIGLEPAFPFVYRKR